MSAIAAPFEGTSAQTCNFSMTDVSFGTVDLSTGSAYDTAATFSASCQGIPNMSVRVCANFAGGSGGTGPSGEPRYMASGANLLAYNLFQDAARTIVWGAYTWPFGLFTAPTIDIPLSTSGQGTASRTVYGRIFSGQNALPSGTYVSSFAGSQTAVTYSYVGPLSCLSILDTNLTQVPFTVTAFASPSCSVSATPLDFGLAGGLSSPIDGTSTIDAACSAGTPFTIALSGGNAGAADPTMRKMAKGGDQIAYGLYRDLTLTLPWGDAIGVNTLSGVGTGSSQVISVYGRVHSQPTPPPGTYTDTIVVTLTY